MCQHTHAAISVAGEPRSIPAVKGPCTCLHHHRAGTQHRDKHTITLRRLRAAAPLTSMLLDWEQEQLNKPHRETRKNMQSPNRVKIRAVTFLVRGESAHRRTTEQASQDK